MTTRPAIPAPPFPGGCLCGEVRYRLTARPLSINACHCNDCKKLTGATHLLMLLMKRDAFTHERGTMERYRKRADSGREVEIVRCTRCGVRLWHDPLSTPEYVLIAAGTLDDPGWAVPTAHIWADKVSPGVRFEEDALVVGGQPANRQAQIEAFARVYGKEG